MKDSYGREIINRIITGEGSPEDVIMCVRYTDERVGREKCDDYSIGNCKRCPIHDSKSHRGVANNDVVITCEYVYDIDAPTQCRVLSLRSRFKQLLRYIGVGK